MSDAILDDASKPPFRAGEDHFDLHEWPFYWLTRAYGQYLSSLEDALRGVELDIPRWRVLMLLEGDLAKSTSYLADEAISKLSTMTRIIGRMQADGLVETRPRASDGRVTEVLLTKNGRRARVLAWQQANDIYEKAFRDISVADIGQLNATLAKIHGNLKRV